MTYAELVSLIKEENVQLEYDYGILIIQRDTIFRCIEGTPLYTGNGYSALIDCFYYGNKYITNSGQLEKYRDERTFEYAATCYRNLLAILTPKLIIAFKAYIKEHYDE